MGKHCALYRNDLKLDLVRDKLFKELFSFIMKASRHILISSVGSILVYLIARSTAAAVGFFIGGVLLDLDHVLDYVLNRGLVIRPSYFFRAFKREAFEYIVVFCHSWELIIAALLVVWFLGWVPFWTGLAVGAGLHLLLDTVFNKHSPPAYFMAFRLCNGFSGRHFYGEREYAKRTGRSADS